MAQDKQTDILYKWFSFSMKEPSGRSYKNKCVCIQNFKETKWLTHDNAGEEEGRWACKKEKKGGKKRKKKRKLAQHHLNNKAGVTLPQIG